MTVQSGSTGTGYDKSLTIAEQVTQTQARIASLVTKGREGTTAIQAARDQLARLQLQQSSHLAAQAATRAVLTAQAATCKGSTAAQPRQDVPE